MPYIAEGQACQPPAFVSVPRPDIMQWKTANKVSWAAGNTNILHLVRKRWEIQPVITKYGAHAWV